MRPSREEGKIPQALDRIRLSPGLPKTHSGKIMRRVLRRIAAGDADTLGDLSTLADPSIVEDLVQGSSAE